MLRFLCLVFCLFCLFFTSCHNTDINKNLTVFRYNESAGITSLDPAFAKDQANIWVCNQLYNGLVQLDDKLIVKPCIAKSWNISADGLTYIFHLRNDVCFHDNMLLLNGKGRKVNAYDFVYSFNRIMDSKVASPGRWIFGNIKQADQKYSFTAADDSTFVIQLNDAFPPFLSLLSMQYCSVVSREAVEYFGKDFRKNPVGTGPFKFKMWKEGVKMVLVKNDSYFEKEGGKQMPYLDAVAITFIIDKQTAFFEFAKGNLDFLSGLDPSYKDELLTQNGLLNSKYREKFKLLRQPYLNTEYLGFLVDKNSEIIKNEPTKLKSIRQAINYAIDRKKMIKFLRNNIGYPAFNGMIPRGLLSYDSVNQIGYNFDLVKAKNLLAEAGYPNGKNLPDITLSTTSSYLDLCKNIQQQLTEIGIHLKIDVIPPGTLRDMIAKSKVPFFRGSWIADYPDAENYLSLFYSKNFTPAGPNYTHFANKDFDVLYEKAKKELSDSVRFKYYRQMDKMIMEDAPVIVLYYDEVLRFVRKDIIDLGSNPMNLLSLKRVKRTNY